MMLVYIYWSNMNIKILISVYFHYNCIVFKLGKTKVKALERNLNLSSVFADKTVSLENIF